MNVETSIRTKIQRELAPAFLNVVNESSNHNVPPNSETHFKVTVVSAEFVGKRPVQRHQTIYALLNKELQGPVHALALHTYTPEEWQQQQGVKASPQCLGGEK